MVGRPSIWIATAIRRILSMSTTDSMCLIGRMQGSMGTGVTVSAIRVQASIWLVVIRGVLPMPTTDFM